MLTMIHSNHAQVQDGKLTVDRKFHLGMQSYLEHIREPIVSVHPQSNGSESTMDMIEVPITGLGYSVLTVKTGGDPDQMKSDAAAATRQISLSAVVYGGGMNSERITRELAIPQIPVLEYDLPTQITVATAGLSSLLRKAVRTTRTSWRYAQNIGNLRRAASLHCNGYPIFDATAKYNSNRLLYLDSRMYENMVITEQDLQTRLQRALLSNTRLRLLFSGRYEPMKGSLDCVRVAIAAIARGLDVELHCYGQGTQAASMRQLAAEPGAQGRVFIHDAVTYPELVEIARHFDVFVCCHVQADPSCTYLESLGSGLPVVGYGNTMWRRLCSASQAGFSSPVGDIDKVVNDIERLIKEPNTLQSTSIRARQFALAHTFEAEFKLRTDDINRTLESRRAQKV